MPMATHGAASCLAITRRGTLLGLAAIGAGHARIAFAEPAPAGGMAGDNRRFAVVLLRGALDGLSAVTPYGDKDLASLRGELLPPPPGQDDGLLDLGGFYGLHPALRGMHGLYAAGELLIVHAVAGPYRSRSHFQAQDYMESGAEERMSSGWLNRVLSALPGGLPQDAAQPAVALRVTVPLLLRGPINVATYAAPVFLPLDLDLYRRIAAINRADPVTGPAIAEALRERGFDQGAISDAGQRPADSDAFTYLAGSAGELMRAPYGPRVAALELEGWDTHSGQPTRLAAALRQLDVGLVALKAALGDDAWRQTCVLIITEFGRTVRANGTRGTDHGTATCAFVAGGAVAGGSVRANWPGLSSANLFEDRDLQPTLDLRSVAKGLLAGHLGLDETEMASVFPGSEAVPLMRGLLHI